MKNLQIIITLGMEVPDDWEVVKHPDGIAVLDIGDGKFMDVNFTPMVTNDDYVGAEWTSEFNYEFVDSVINMVKNYDTEMKVLMSH